MRQIIFRTLLLLAFLSSLFWECQTDVTRCSYASGSYAAEPLSLENGSSSASKTSALTPEEVSNALESQDFSLSLLETIQLESGRAEIFPLYAALGNSNWLTRYDFTFARYLPFYRFKKKVEASTPAEMDECVAKIDSLSLKEKAYVLTALYIYEREKRVRPKEELDSHAAQREEIEGDIRDRESKGLYVPSYARSPYFYGNPVDVLLPYEPNETIDEATWRRWTEIYRRYGNNTETAIEAFRPEEPNNVEFDRKMQYRSPRDRESAAGLFAEWLADLDLCAKLIKDNLGFDVAESYFNYPLGKNWESEFSHHYVYRYPVKPVNPSADPDDIRSIRYKGPHGFRLNENSSSLFMENFLKGIENIERADQSCKDVMVALRDYWFATQLLPPQSFTMITASGMFTGPYTGNSSRNPLTLRQLSFFILERRLFYSDLKLSLSDSETAKAEASLDEALAITEEYSADEPLLETIRRAASESEIFPVFTFDYPSNWNVHYENAFERYLPFYLFKTKVGSASPQEIDECVGKYDELTGKEKAYVLAAVFVYERAKRKRSPEILESEQWLIDKTVDACVDAKKRNLYVPKIMEEQYFTGSSNDLLFPPYEPDDSIGEDVWTRWIDLLEKQTENAEIAFEAFRPNELAPKEKIPYTLSEKDPLSSGCFIDLDDSELAREWRENLRFCAYVVQKYLNVDEGAVQLRSPDYLSAFSMQKGLTLPDWLLGPLQQSEGKYLCDFFKGIDDYDSAKPEKKLLYALRDYWATFQIHPYTGLRYEQTYRCNSSAYPRGVGEIANYLLHCRGAMSKRNLELYDFIKRQKNRQTPAASPAK